MEVYHDARVYDTGMVTIIECMGRHAGWLTAAAALAQYKGNGPDLIYVPEVAFDMDKFLASVKKIYEANKKCIVAGSEGIHDADGVFITEYANKNATKDSFGHAQLGGLAAFLANEVKKATGAKVRGIELSLLQRCAAHAASETDVEESFMGARPRWRTRWTASPTRWWASSAPAASTGIPVPSQAVRPLRSRQREKKLPLEWINETGVRHRAGLHRLRAAADPGSADVTYEDGLPALPSSRRSAPDTKDPRREPPARVLAFCKEKGGTRWILSPGGRPSFLPPRAGSSCTCARLPAPGVRGVPELPPQPRRHLGEAAAYPLQGGL
jgi:6-phosphofructokinase 1